MLEERRNGKQSLAFSSAIIAHRVVSVTPVGLPPRRSAKFDCLEPARREILLSLMLVDERQFKTYMPPEEIREVISSLAAQLNRDFGVDDKVLLVGVLKGAIMVMADLVRELHSDVRVDFVRTTNFGKSADSSGTVCLLKDIQCDVRDTHIVIVEEIIDSGRALKFLYDRFRSAQPKSLRVATMMDKREKRLVDVKVDYVGKLVDDQFLIGYGLDLEEKCRNLPAIYALRYPN